MAMSALGKEYMPVGQLLDERVFVNGIVGLLATGGSTNHTIHLIAMAAAAGIRLEWSDFEDLANVVPLLVRVYPNGKADVINGSRRKRIAAGAGVDVSEVNKLLKMHRQMADMMKKMGKGGRMPQMPGMGGMPGGLPPGIFPGRR